MKFVWFVLAIFSCVVGDELQWKLGGCSHIPKWKFDPAGNDELEIRAIEYYAKKPNNIDFKVWVKNGSGKNLCKAVKKGELKPSKQGVIRVQCGDKKTPYVFGTSVYLKFPKGKSLVVCSTKVIVEGSLKHKCPANAKEVSYGDCVCKEGYTVKNGACAKVTCPANSSMWKNGNCECNKGYTVKGQSCQKVLQQCSANSRRVGTKCKCNAGYDSVGGKCYTKCPRNSRRSGTSCKCNSGYDLIAGKCYKKCPSHSSRHGTTCKCSSGYDMKGSSCVKKAAGCQPTGSVTTLAVNAGTARQSTTAYGSGGAPGRALDSNTGGHWTKNTCTHTLHYNEKGNKQIPWWSVELTRKAEVQAVGIQNREDCCSHRLANFRIMVDNQQCRHFPGTFSGRKTLPCSRPVIGKKITIRLSTNREPLTLCDVTIKGRRLTGGACGGNSGACSPKAGNRHLAVNVNTARQATLAYGNGGAPGRAVDGDDGGHWSKNTCTHTLHYNEQGNKQIPWWSVELMQPGLVKGLEIQNRIDCCAHRLTNFSIRVDGKLCKFHAGSFNGRKTIYCDRPVCGKKIEIKLATNREPLTLCDVRVIGA